MNLMFFKSNKHLYRDELKKLLIGYSVSFIVISTILLVGFIQIYTNRIVRINNHESNQSAHKAINQELEGYVDAIGMMEKEPVFIDFIQTGRNQSEIYRIMYDLINDREVKSIFYYVDKEGNTILTNNYLESPYSGSEIFLSGLFKQLNQKQEQVVFLNNKVQIDLTKRTVYSIGKSMVQDGEIVGYLIFDILESDLNKIAYQSKVEVLVLTDQYNNVIISTNSLVLNGIGKLNLIQKDKHILEFNGNDYYSKMTEFNQGLLRIYTLSELEIVSDLMSKSLLFMVITFVIITGIAVILAEASAKKKTEAIRNLIDSINRVQKGDLSAYVKLGQTDEFKLIGEQFNHMLVDLDGLMTKNNELTDRNRLSEIKQLESQFNPHFIFNTLETLKYMVHIDQEKASEIIVSFAAILRYSIDYNKKEIPLEQDLDYLNSYLIIQRYRYNKRLSCEFQVDQVVKDCIVPKLIMQPIIENCINHGYRSKESLNIHIRVQVQDGALITVISDDGDGMSSDQLMRLQSDLSDSTNDEGRIGLKNVHRRLRLMYGEPYGLSISSIENEGTNVMIRMPIVRW